MTMDAPLFLCMRRGWAGGRSLAAILATLALLACLSAPVFAADKPNILFIFSDDHAYNAVGCYGNAQVRTPALDSLAARGVRFTNAYNQGGWHGAVCVASRTMLNTGKFLWASREAEKDLRKVWQDQGQLWSQRLAKAGYDTYFTGKWHVRADAEKLFMQARHIRPGMPNQTKEGYDRPHEGKPDTWDPTDPKFGGFWKGGKHWSEIVADDAIEFLDHARPRDNPFFMYIAFNAPHDPRQAPKEYVDMYPWQSIDLPQPFLEQIPFGIVPNRLRDERLAPFPRTEFAVKVNRAEYYAIITHMDAQIARILAHLKATGQEANTQIIFSADHGLACGHHGFMGKQNMHDHSVRVPLIMAGPGIPQGQTRQAKIYLQDVMPTTLAWAGADTANVDFKSLLPLISDPTAESYDAIYGAYVMSQRQVTKGDWKLIIYPDKKVVLLYNLKDDPDETKNLADDPAHQAKVRELLAELKRLQEQTADPLVLPTLSALK